VSADTRGTPRDNPASNDHARSAESERTRAAEREPGRQADAGRPQQHQSTQTLNRADYNRARHDAPPIQRSGDSGYREQGSPRDPAAGNGGQRRTEQATLGRAAETAAGGQRRAETLNRVDYNRARHDAPPIQRDESGAARPMADTGIRRTGSLESGGAREAGRPRPEADDDHASRRDVAATTARADEGRDAKHMHEHDSQAARPSDLPARALSSDAASASPDRAGTGHAAADADRGADTGHDQQDTDPMPGAARSELRSGEESWPTRQDRDHGRELYQEYLKDMLSGRERGSNVVGEKPDRSPGDTSDLPPDGEELLRMEDDDASLSEKVRDLVDHELEDIDDAVKETASDIHDLFLHPPPGHPEVAVPVGPEISPPAVQHGTLDPAGIAEIVLVGGVLGTAAGHWLWTKVLNREGDHHAGN
jgi:hypothetical protein